MTFSAALSLDKLTPQRLLLEIVLLPNQVK
jgi:hypothetical protein